MSELRTNKIYPRDGLPAGASGGIIQIVRTNFVDFYSNTSLIPLDDTIPQITEGGEITTATITPTSSSNKILISVVMQVANDNAGNLSTIALFRNSVSDALAASWARTIAANNPNSPMTIEYLDSPATTSPVTYRVRGGYSAGSSSTFQVNGGSGARYFGGALTSGITLMEVSG